MLIQGCTFQEKLQYFLQEPKESGQSDESDEYYEPDPPKEDKPMSELYYAYHGLDEEKQKIYLEIYDALSGMKSGVPLSYCGQVCAGCCVCLRDERPPGGFFM